MSNIIARLLNWIADKWASFKNSKRDLTSILNFLAMPTRIFKAVRDYLPDGMRGTDTYEHIYGPFAVLGCFHWLPFWYRFSLWCILFSWHVVGKEITLDYFYDKKPWCLCDVITRSYGCLLAAIFLI